MSTIGGHELTLPPTFQFGTTNKTPSFLSKFPLGKIPAFEGSDGFLLTESNAIALYLADTAPNPGKRDHLLGATPQERALVQQWLWFSFLHLETALTTLCVWRYGDGQFAKYDAVAEGKAEGDLKRWLGYLDGAIKDVAGKGVWLAGTEKPSIADLAVCGQLYSGFLIYVDAEMRKGYPVLVEYFNRLLEEVPEIKELYNLDGKWVEVRKQPDAASAV